MNLDDLRNLAQSIRDEIGKAVHGQDDAVDLLLVSLLARSVAAALKLDFGRIQFTPDLMPGDVLGASIFDFSTNEFRLTKGPIFTDILLADEINRAPPKTQAALLQVMNEGIATIDGTDHQLGECFFVIATQNPIEHQGTYPLPEAQLDRFLFKIVIDFPDEDSEIFILTRNAERPLEYRALTSDIGAVAGIDEIRQARSFVDNIRLDDTLVNYIVSLVRATRSDPQILYGASTRAADALAGAARALAALEGRDYALPDDIKRLFAPALRHRIVLGPAAEIEGLSPELVLENTLNQVEAPR
jgi:MoxR-like ATPase